MENDMIERVARALQLHEWGANNPEPPPEFYGEVRALWMGFARAAIEAMREPTEAMAKAAHQTIARENCGFEYSVTVGYRAMIDAALQPRAPITVR